VFLPDEFQQLGQTSPDVDPRAPDLWLAARSGYSFSDSFTGDQVIAPRSSTGGTHGYLPDQPDMWGTLVLQGNGIKPGTDLAKVSSMDVAPTIARILGVQLPSAEGQALSKALK
jgi:hypothetical protein